MQRSSKHSTNDTKTSPGPKVAINVPRNIELARQAQEMEKRLQELRLAMEKEREGRKSSDGPRWRNGASGLLRGQYRSKQQAQGSAASPHHSPSSRSPLASQAASRSASKTVAAAGAASGSASSKDVSPRAPASRLQQDAGLGGVSGERVVVPAPGGLRVSQGKKAAAIAGASPAPDVLQVHAHQDQGRVSTAHSQGSQDEPGLKEGAFDEAESHNSFMQALNEWRAGNRAAEQQSEQQPQPQQQQQQQPQKKYGLKQLQQDGIQGARASSAGANSDVASGVQTEPPPPPTSRPTSARHLSYFDRLLLSSASREAGQAASSSGREGRTSPPPSSGGTLHPPHTRPAPPHLHLHSQHALPPLGQCHSPTTTATTPSGAPHAQGPLSPSSLTHLAQQQQQQQQQPLLGSQHHHPSSSSFSSEVYSVDCALNPSLPLTSGSHKHHHKHKGLDILEELERLELQRHKASQRYDSDEEGPGGVKDRGQQEQDTIVVTTQVGTLGLTKGVRLPDAIWVPQEEAEQQQAQQRQRQ